MIPGSLQDDLDISCVTFRDGDTGVCTCAVDKTELDSTKCSLSVRPILIVPITLTGASGNPTDLCRYIDYTTGSSVIYVNEVISCTVGTVSGNVYPLIVEIRANKTLHEGATFDGTPACLNSFFSYGLSKSFSGIPIIFGKLFFLLCCAIIRHCFE